MKTKISMAALATVIALAACAMFTGPGRVVLYAQSLPATVHAQWDPPATAENTGEGRRREQRQGHEVADRG